jgi:predicted ATPase
MIRELQINNYKSLHDLTLEVGRFNVLIGENGCGKSNLLESIALAAAAAADKLDNEFLASRGIRVTEPQLMRSAFDSKDQLEPITIGMTFTGNYKIEYYLHNDNEPYSEWEAYPNEDTYHYRIESWKLIESDKIQQTNPSSTTTKKERKINSKRNLSQEDFEMLFEDFIAKFASDSTTTKKERKLNSKWNLSQKDYEMLFEDFIAKFASEGAITGHKTEEEIKKFIIYSPENTALRNFYKEGQIEPLGINGEGLLKLLKVIQSKSDEQRQEIHTCLQLFDWYDELEIPKDLSLSEDKVTITDRYLTQVFDQRSANEGFLFVLFYIALMVSDDTPRIFAIDNIDTSLNPKLCTKLIKELVRLAKKYDKQVFVTTHNPAILDGIDLGDDEQRLLVVSRNKQGHTRFKRVTLEDKPRSSTGEGLKLSEAFLRGYLGGLPKGF